MRMALDTNRYTDLIRRVPEVERTVATAAFVSLPFVVLAELNVGFRRGTKRAENEAHLQLFLSRPNRAILYPDARTVELYADLTAGLLSAGTPLPVHDVWIAAVALQHGLAVYARDKHFDRLPQVTRI